MALSDILKKYGDTQATEGIVGIMSPSVQTEQQVYDSATDGIMTVSNKKYIGPKATITYGTAEQGFPRMLREIEQGELPQFDQTTFPKQGEGIVAPPSTTPPPPVTTPVEPTPEIPEVDPCPPGFKYDPVKKMCVPIVVQEDGDDRPQFINKPRNIGDTAKALGQITDVLREQGATQDGTYQDDVNYTIDNSTGLSFFGGIGKLLDNVFNKGPADKLLESLGGSTEGITVTKNEDGTRNVLITNNQGKANVGRLLTAESLSGNVASTQKTNAQGNVIRAPNGQLMIQGPVQINPYSKVLFKPETRTAAQTDALNAEEKNKLIKELNDMIPEKQTLGISDERAVGPTLNFDEIIRENLDPIGQGVPFAGDAVASSSSTPFNITDIRPVNLGRGTTTKSTSSVGQVDRLASDAASGADAQKSLMTDTRRLDRVSEPAGQEPDFLRQQQTQERQERKQKEKEQKARIGYGQNIDQDIIDANKKDSDREAQRQTGDSTMRALTDRYGNAVKDSNGKVVTNPAPKSGGGGGSGGGSPKIVCTMMNDFYGFGSFRNKIWLAQSKNLSKEYEIGYHTLFLPLVKYAKQKGFINSNVKKILEHIAIHRTIDIRKQKYNKINILGRIYRVILEPLCYITGRIKLWKKKK
jgi:hypothetical protein